MAEYKNPMREEDFPLDVSASQPVGFGTYDQLAALASWMSLALPGRGGIGDPADPLRKLVRVLMAQERPAGKQRIPGDLNWVARDPETGGRYVTVNPVAGNVGRMDEISGATGGIAIPYDLNHYLARRSGTRSGIMSDPDLHVLKLSKQDVYDWLFRRSREKPNMDWRKAGRRFKF